MLTRRNFLLKAGLATPLLFGGYAFGVEPRRLLATQYQVAPPQWRSGPTLRIAVLADKRVIGVGTIPQLLALDHPWIQEYFRGPRGRAAAVTAEEHATA